MTILIFGACSLIMSGQNRSNKKDSGDEIEARTGVLSRQRDW